MNSNDESIMLIVRIGTSKREKKLLSIMHLMALFAIVLSDMELYIQSVSIAAIMASGLFHYRRYFSVDTKTLLRYSEKFGWEIFGEDRYIPIQILGSSVLTPLVICLHYVLNNKTHRMVVFNDALNEKDYRKLTVYLKMTGPGEQAIES